VKINMWRLNGLYIPSYNYLTPRAAQQPASNQKGHREPAEKDAIDSGEFS